ncbi:MAG: lipid-A-disaccharide synthase N-terminal domain-containing protein [Candidatus Eremiobacteraeota bacterium]|nr:lipid-A-disaccharide synthase N-terminal domain-containing protein [Candidatus Eremiobacteraeota bacterium]
MLAAEYTLFGLKFSGWTVFGFIFQACFMARFWVQWIASERAKRSVIPTAFWFFSIIGASGLLTYAIVHLKDPVFAFGQSTGLFIYFRNIVLIRRSQKEDQLKAEEAAAAGKSTEE